MVDVAALSRGNLRRLALSIALAALGVACLVAVTMTGPARVPAGFTLLEKNPAKSIQNRAARSAAQVPGAPLRSPPSPGAIVLASCVTAIFGVSTWPHAVAASA